MNVLYKFLPDIDIDIENVALPVDCETATLHASKQNRIETYSKIIGSLRQSSKLQHLLS